MPIEITDEDIIDAFAEAKYEADHSSKEFGDDSPEHCADVDVWNWGFGYVDGVVDFNAVARHLTSIIRMKAGDGVAPYVRVVTTGRPRPSAFGIERACQRIRAT